MEHHKRYRVAWRCSARGKGRAARKICVIRQCGHAHPRPLRRGRAEERRGLLCGLHPLGRYGGVHAGRTDKSETDGLWVGGLVCGGGCRDFGTWAPRRGSPERYVGEPKKVEVGEGDEEDHGGERSNGKHALPPVQVAVQRYMPPELAGWRLRQLWGGAPPTACGCQGCCLLGTSRKLSLLW